MKTVQLLALLALFNLASGFFAGWHAGGFFAWRKANRMLERLSRTIERF